MQSFSYDALPGRVVFGAGASRQRLAEEIARLGAARVLLIATARARPLAEELAAPLGERVAGVFSDVQPHVPAAIAEAARAAARNAGADCLLAIGGGSTIGAAKAIALDLPLPIVAVPTTYAGSEMTPIWGITSGQRKQTGRSPMVLPKVVIYDPELTYSLPASVTGPSAINALAHSVEALYTPGTNPVVGLIAEEGIRALARGTPIAVARPTDPAGRAETLYGAYLAGAALAAAGTGLHHKICHVLGGAYNLPHAETHTVILPHAVAFNEPAIPDVMARIARALGCNRAAAGIYMLIESLGTPVALKDIGMRAEDLEAAVDLIMEAAPQANPRPVDAIGIRQLIEDAYAGRAPDA
jgi:alcohol dehydrogenase class IV